MRRLVSLQQVIDRAKKDGTDLRDLAVDEDDVVSLDELDDDEEDSDDEED